MVRTWQRNKIDGIVLFYRIRTMATTGMYMLFISYKERRQLSELSRMIYERVNQAIESRKATLYIPIHWELTDYARTAKYRS